jgi:tRNA modification GTPase
MGMYRADTIVACATPAGRGAIAIVRWSGRDALDVARKVFRPKGGRGFEAWRMRLGAVVAADGVTPIDEALGVYFPSPRSFTGEDTFEVHSHGSPVVVEQIVASAIAAGARAAERGEFTRRAVLNGKIDLLQAEAIADLIDARMAAGAAAAWQQLQGALSGELASLRARLVEILADLEARIDFTDDELPDEDFERRARGIDAVAERLLELRDGFAAARRQREGVRVVFTGRPNAGKSSLVNRLLGSGRMIVSAEPGTTRDAVEEAVDLGGVAFVFTDTAGIRSGAGPAETEAVRRARECAREADLRVLVLDASLAFQPGDEELWEEVRGPRTVVVLNKSDLGASYPEDLAERFREGSASLLSTSACTGAGCDLLAEELLALAKRGLESEPAGISRVRHRAALERTLEPLGRARRLVMHEDACELAVVELRDALAELSSIGEAVDNEEVLDRIFSEFCIGK